MIILYLVFSQKVAFSQTQREICLHFLCPLAWPLPGPQCGSRFVLLARLSQGKSSACQSEIVCPPQLRCLPSSCPPPPTSASRAPVPPIEPLEGTDAICLLAPGWWGSSEHDVTAFPSRSHPLGALTQVCECTMMGVRKGRSVYRGRF